MITHVIYELRGLKVGCTHNLSERMKYYPRHQKRLLRVLEEIHDATNETAGDREHWWQDHLGYKRESHYAHTVEISYTARQRAAEAITHEQKVEWSRKAGKNRAKNLSPERLSEIGKMGGYCIRVQCPHCGIESHVAILHRWHFDNCPKKPVV
jgi:hypothetical protein